jgi:hypothetical protein
MCAEKNAGGKVERTRNAVFWSKAFLRSETYWKHDEWKETDSFYKTIPKGVKMKKFRPQAQKDQEKKPKINKHKKIKNIIF